MLNKKILALALSACLCFSLTACKERRILVFAAASLEPVLGEIFVNYKEKTGQSVEANYASSGQLLMQLESGADANIFISAGGKQAARAQDLGIARDSWPILKNTLVMVWKNGSYTSINDAINAKTIAMGEPEAVPAGQYAREALLSADIYEKVSKKSVYLSNVREVLTAVQSGNADVGFVYKTDALDSGLEYIEVPQELYSVIGYPLVLLNTKENFGQAEKLADYLFSQEAKGTFEKNGFTFVERNTQK